MTTGKTEATQAQTISTLRRACSSYLRQIDDLKEEANALNAEIARQKQLIYALECTMSRMDERQSW